jgi:uncharacterized membrane protein
MSRSLRHITFGFLLGAGVVYFGDRSRGRQRRARVRDALASARRKEQRLLGKALRDAAYRVHGAFERARHPQDDSAVPDEVIVGRVRAQLGRVVTHSHAIEATAAAGVVCLSGPVLEAEADRAMREVSRVPGVRDVIDELERHANAERIPALQGGVRPGRSEQWTPAARGAALVGGIGLALWGVVSRRGLISALASVGGCALAVRGGTNLPLERVLALASGRAGIEVRKTIRVNAPVDQVFELWSRYERFPKFMQHVRDVCPSDADPKRSRWTVDGPGGVPWTFEVEILRHKHGREIAWTTVPGQRVAHMGVVRFESSDHATHVHIQMRYFPPAGMIGHAIAHLLGWDPKARLDDDLVRLKALLEDGRTRAHGEHVALSDIAYPPRSEP